MRYATRLSPGAGTFHGEACTITPLRVTIERRIKARRLDCPPFPEAAEAGK